MEPQEIEKETVAPEEKRETEQPITEEIFYLTHPKLRELEDKLDEENRVLNANPRELVENYLGNSGAEYEVVSLTEYLKDGERYRDKEVVIVVEEGREMYPLELRIGKDKTVVVVPYSFAETDEDGNLRLKEEETELRIMEIPNLSIITKGKTALLGFVFSTGGVLPNAESSSNKEGNRVIIGDRAEVILSHCIIGNNRGEAPEIFFSVIFANEYNGGVFRLEDSKITGNIGEQRRYTRVIEIRRENYYSGYEEKLPEAEISNVIIRDNNIPGPIVRIRAEEGARPKPIKVKINGISARENTANAILSFKGSILPTVDDSEPQWYLTDIFVREGELHISSPPYNILLERIYGPRINMSNPGLVEMNHIATKRKFLVDYSTNQRRSEINIEDSTIIGGIKVSVTDTGLSRQENFEMKIINSIVGPVEGNPRDIFKESSLRVEDSVYPQSQLSLEVDEVQLERNKVCPPSPFGPYADLAECANLDPATLIPRGSEYEVGRPHGGPDALGRAPHLNEILKKRNSQAGFGPYPGGIAPRLGLEKNTFTLYLPAVANNR